MSEIITWIDGRTREKITVTNSENKSPKAEIRDEDGNLISEVPAILAGGKIILYKDEDNIEFWDRNGIFQGKGEEKPLAKVGEAVYNVIECVDISMKIVRYQQEGKIKKYILWEDFKTFMSDMKNYDIIDTINGIVQNIYDIKLSAEIAKQYSMTIGFGLNAFTLGIGIHNDMRNEEDIYQATTSNAISKAVSTAIYSAGIGAMAGLGL